MLTLAPPPLDTALNDSGQPSPVWARWIQQLWTSIRVENWHEIGATGEPAFENSWVNFGTSWETAAFFKDPAGVVHLKGLVKSGTVPGNIFTLPAGYRPPLGIHFAAISNDAFAKLQVLDDGSVRADIGSSSWFSINCSFRAA